MTHDAHHDWLIVIPTVADPDVLPDGLRRLQRHLSGTVHLVLSVNPVSAARAEETMGVVDLLRPAFLAQGHTLTVERAPGPLGFAKAVNAGLRAGLSEAGLPPRVLILNDDVRVTSGFLAGLEAAFEAEEITLYGEPADAHGDRPRHPVAGYGRIGAVGPTSDVVAGTQCVRMPPAEAKAAREDLDRYAYGFRAANTGETRAADFLSGFCLALRREAFLDVVAPGERLFAEDFGIGGYEDNDLCVRLDTAGWRLAIAADTFVGHLGHQTLDRYFPGQKRGVHIANRLAYYRRWEHLTQGPKRVVACYRFGPTFVHDLHLMRLSVEKAADLVDGIAVLLTRNPIEVLDAWDADLVNGLPDADRAFLRALSGADADAASRALVAWLGGMIPAGRGVSVRAQVWTESVFNERTERNAAIALAESLDADWIWSIDHDEVVEPRVTRRHLDRLIHHPDPMVRAWDFGWCNHWDTPRVMRVDRPWGDGGTYAGGMRGFRLWRVNKAAPRAIQAGNAIGLHCGNCPDADPLAKRVAAVRFRHFGYLRVQDRQIKAARYRQIDPNPHAALTGGGYGHLTAEEGMQLSPYVAANGIGFTMLTYEREAPEDLARWLDLVHGLADRAVIVWTGDPDGIPEAVREVCRRFDAELLARPFDGDLATARNVGLDRLRTYASEGVAWLWTMDPDEHLEDEWAAAVSARRMAECSSTYGFLVRFRNLRPPETGEPPTTSETLRFVRLDPEGVMRWAGRVHEGFIDAVTQLGASRANLLLAPWWAINTGLAQDDMAIEQKLRRYQSALLEELAEHPLDAGSWVALGLQYENDGAILQAEECFQNALATGHPGYLPPTELMLHYLRRAMYLADEVVRRAPGHGARTPYLRDVALWLRRNIGPFPVSGAARRGPVPPEKIPPVPAFPAPPTSEG